MTPEEKAAAYDRLCEMLLVPPGFPAAAAYAAVEQLVDERNDARDARASLELDLASVTAEVERSHCMLGMIYDDLILLECTLSMEQVLLCPVDRCKYWKRPEWEEKGVHYASPEGKAAAKQARRVRAEQLLEWARRDDDGFPNASWRALEQQLRLQGEVERGDGDDDE